ncbi:MAG: hypothetical protein R3D26_21030 [Cyanobacteriota/Melainabacteria group bacterium]
MHAAIFRIEEEFLHVEPASAQNLKRHSQPHPQLSLQNCAASLRRHGAVLLLIAFFLYNRLNNGEKADGIAMSKPYADPNVSNGINGYPVRSSMLDGAEAVTDKDIIAGRVKGIKGNLQLSDSQVTEQNHRSPDRKEM